MAFIKSKTKKKFKLYMFLVYLGALAWYYFLYPDMVIFWGLVIAGAIGVFLWVFKKKKPKRRAVPEDLKRKVLARFNGTCAVCNKRILLELHHRVPVNRGGKDSYENLVYLCQEHHALAHATRPEEVKLNYRR